MIKNILKKKSFNKIIILILISVLIFLNLLFYHYSNNDDNPVDNNYRSSNSSKNLEKANGIVTNVWLEDSSKLKRFQKNNIKYLFVDIGDTDKKGKIKTSEGDIENFLLFVEFYEKENNYEFVLLPYSEIITENYDISSERFKENFVLDYSNLISKGFDGLLIDIEPVPKSYEQDYLEIVNSLRNSLPEKSIISAYSLGISESSDSWTWNSDFFKEICDRVDLIEIAGYDTGMDNQKEYENYIKQQIENIASGNYASYFLFTVPTHKKYPETIDNALGIYHSEILNYENSSFIGIAIFAEWTTDENEWKIFENYNQ